MALIRRPSLTFPRNPKQVPKFPVELGSNAPRGLLLSVVGNDQNFRNLVTGHLPDTRSQALLVVGSRGTGFSNVDQNAISPQFSGMGYQMAAPQVFSMEALVQTGTSLNASETIFVWDDQGSGSSGSYDRWLSGAATGGAYSLYTYPGGTTGGGTAFAANTTSHVCATDDGSTANVYVDGALVATGGTGSAYSGFTLPNSYCVLGGGHDRGWWSGKIFLANVANVCWTAAEVSDRAAEPFAMFRPVVRRQYFLLSAGGTGTGTGTIAGTSTVSATGSSNATSTGSVTGTSTASATGSANDLSTGTIAASASVSGVGAASDLSTGSVTGTSTSNATGQAQALTTGSVTGTSTSSATGLSNAASTGTIAASASVSGVGADTDTATGSVTGTSTSNATGQAQALTTGSVTGTSTSSATALSSITTWNPSDKTAAITLSNGNLTATSVGSSQQSVRSTSSKNSGLVYWEVTFSTVQTNVAVGVANSSYLLNAGAGLGGDGDSTGWYAVSPTSGLYIGGTFQYSGASASTSGEILYCAMDFTHGKFWFSSTHMRSASTPWNWGAIGVQNPATNTGGYSFVGTVGGSPPNGGMNAGPYYAVFNDSTGGAVAVANFGATTFNGTIPTGFSSWDAQNATGTLTATVKKPTTSLTAKVNETSTLTATVKKPTTSLTANVNETGTLTAIVKKPTSSLTANVNETGTLTATVKKSTASISGNSAAPNETGTLTATVKKSTASFTANVNETSTLTATVKKPTTSIAGSSGTADDTGTLTATVKKSTASFTANVNETSTLTATVKKAVASLNGAAPAAQTGGAGDSESDPVNPNMLYRRSRRQKINDKRKLRQKNDTEIKPDDIVIKPPSYVGLETFATSLAQQAAHQAMMDDEDDVAAVLAMA